MTINCALCKYLKMVLYGTFKLYSVKVINSTKIYLFPCLVFDVEHGINQLKQYNTYYAFNRNKNCTISFSLNTVELNPTDIWDHVDQGDRR